MSQQSLAVPLAMPSSPSRPSLRGLWIFLGLIALMVVVIVVGKIMVAKKSKAAAPVAAAPAPAAAPKPVLAAAAPGTAGEVKLFDVADKEAAMLMAIVANKLGKPLNELRFKSIKEVK